MIVLSALCAVLPAFWLGFLFRGLRDLHGSTAATLEGVRS